MTASAPVSKLAAVPAPPAGGSLRDRLVREVEQEVDRCRANKDELLEQAALLEQREDEARQLLQAIKKGA